MKEVNVCMQQQRGQANNQKADVSLLLFGRPAYIIHHSKKAKIRLAGRAFAFGV